jgi:malate dehydrogenase (quinone)
MSATMGAMLHRLQPNWKIQIFERLGEVAQESSHAWNNAGTGHAAYCELNYTNLRNNGTVDCSKAFKINEQFEQSKQFWAFLTEEGCLQKPEQFIHNIPHLSFVQGAEDVSFLRKRYDTLKQSHLFKNMVYSEDPAQLERWMPLMMQERDKSVPVAATYMEHGTDVDFGALTRALFEWLRHEDTADMYLQHDVRDITRNPTSGHWKVRVRDLTSDDERTVHAKFVFIGAGGGSLELLDKSEIPEADGYGGFPVSGQWLRCVNTDIIEQHHAKVYGKASVGTPPMSVPHLDTRVIDGRKELLFGPFAGFSTKFLKQGSYFDLFKSIGADNIIPMLQAGMANLPLTKYLIEQVLQSQEDRVEALRVFVPTARAEDWILEVAGQRVQVIRKDEENGGVLEFGTEVVNATDGSLAALLGASPGASTAVAVVLDVLKKCFGKGMKTDAWKKKMEEMVPGYGKSLAKDPLLHARLHNWTNRILQLSE